MGEERFERILSSAPSATGVYLMKDGEGRVIYVGKAKNLKSRLRSYFRGTDSRPSVPFLVARLAGVDFIVTATEKEALILENNLIKEHRPRYNVFFRDDKSYYSLRLDPADPFPWFQLVRRVRKDGARYFGPYPSGFAAKETMHFLQQIFPLRTCGDRSFRTRRRPCIEYEIQRCLAPCCGLVASGDYHGLVRDVIAFLEGRGKALLSDLRRRMEEASRALDFEEAARIRDRISAIEETLEKQRIVSASPKDQDAFGLYREGNLTQAFGLHVRGGKILGRKTFPLVRLAAEPPEVLSSLLKQYYGEERFVPEEILIGEGIEDREVLEEWLSEKRGGRVSVLVPRKGPRRAVLAMAEKNAEQVFKTARDVESEEAALQILRERLHLRNLPETIECFDVSNIGGLHAVGSMVVFSRGRPLKSGYRHFRIRGVAGADDYAMLREVLERRYRDRENLPDLIVIDGGKGQLGVALSVLRELGVEGPDVIGLAKESAAGDGEGPAGEAKRAGVRKDEDRVYLAKRKDPVYISRYPAAYLFLQRVRDEAHRFAIGHHRRLMEKRLVRSVLDDVPGVGPRRKQALLAHFGDAGRIGEASPEEVARIGRVSRRKADEIIAHLKGFRAGQP